MKLSLRRTGCSKSILSAFRKRASFEIKYKTNYSSYQKHSLVAVPNSKYT